jgi:Fe-S-cluster containining protein
MTTAGASLDSLAYFQQLNAHFSAILSEPRARARLPEALLVPAWQSFEANVARQCVDQPPVDCGRGCATCCTLRVTATAPEVLLLADFIRAVAPALRARGVDLRAQVAAAHDTTSGLGEQARVAARQRCPFIAQGVCVVYQVRPLACRGLASHDRKACARAAAGKIDQIPYSEPHMRVRSLVQNALQSALRDAGLPWLAYELNQALLIALDDDDTGRRWLQGDDVFAAAQVHEVDVHEMAQTFDQIKQLSA